MKLNNPIKLAGIRPSFFKSIDQLWFVSFWRINHTCLF